MINEAKHVLTGLKTMACKVKNISVAFDPLSESSTFTNGDYISGRVTLEVVKETHIKSLFVKAKGEASVRWSENHGRYNVVVYHDKETCFKTIQYFIQEEKKGKTSPALKKNVWLPVRSGLVLGMISKSYSLFPSYICL